MDMRTGAAGRPAEKTKASSTRPAEALVLAVFATLAALAALAGCGGDPDPGFLGSAVVEAQGYQVATTVPGRLAAVHKQEGMDVAAGELLAVVDTVPLSLQVREAEAGLKELTAGRRAREHEIRAARAEILGLEKDLARIAPLVKEGALPPQQEDRLTASLDAARNRRSAGENTLAGLEGKEEGLKARLELLREQIRRCYLRAPSPGRILTRYRNPEEVVGAGQPVYEVGRDDTLQVDFFVPQADLAGIRYGQPLRLRLDRGGGETVLPATVSWIGREAEFSPRNVQTRESRNELVFRVRALAANRDGLLKRGLPVEVWKAE